MLLQSDKEYVSQFTNITQENKHYENASTGFRVLWKNKVTDTSMCT